MFDFDLTDYRICWILGTIVMALLIIFGNSMTLLTLWLNRKKFSVTSNHLILSLTISDLLVAPAVIYNLILLFNPELDNKFSCILRYVFLSMVYTSGYYNIVAIAIDRYISIIYPLQYPAIVTKKLIYTGISVIWSASFLISTVPLYWNAYTPMGGCKLSTIVPRVYVMAIVIPNLVAVWLGISILYWRIWREARSFTKRLSIRSRGNGQVCNVTNRKSNQMVLAILGCFSFCCLPVMVSLFLYVFQQTSTSSDIAFCASYWIAMCSSCANPFIYAWKKPTYRKVYMKLKKLFRRAHDATSKNDIEKQVGPPKNVAEGQVFNKLRTISAVVEQEAFRQGRYNVLKT